MHNFCSIYLFSEAVLGEHVLGTDPDCANQRRKIGCIAPRIVRNVTEQNILMHESYKKGVADSPNDIALIRLNEPIPLFYEDSSISSVIPVCLPWSETDPGRTMNSGDRAMVIYILFCVTSRFS